jgi:hypothetical protein
MSDRKFELTVEDQLIAESLETARPARLWALASSLICAGIVLVLLGLLVSGEAI